MNFLRIAMACMKRILEENKREFGPHGNFHLSLSLSSSVFHLNATLEIFCIVDSCSFYLSNSYVLKGPKS
jgi:hypothetical protein